MLDPTVSLSFALHSQKGVFALLLGSGVSRAAGIPTGWEIVQNLCRKLALLVGDDCEPDPAAWFREKYGKDADYAELLEMVGRTPSERQNLLRSYFEPSEEDREEGKKAPTAAHRAIASLVAKGVVTVIITTNFDRLLEAALQEEGIHPSVISTPDSAKGAVPLVHNPCTIVKVHGDYLDTRIKNAPGELEEYDQEINNLLDRIFDDYGLIVCGWSGDWDTALRLAIERTPNRRFSTYWAARGKVSEVAQRLIDHRGAQIISGIDADKLFPDLKEKVDALEMINRQHPLSPQIAVARLKKNIEDGKVIAAHDLIQDETERVASELGPNSFPFNSPLDGQIILGRMQQYESLVETLAQLLATGCFWGDSATSDIWHRALDRIANARPRDAGTVLLIELRKYPALVCFYAAGIACIANDRWDNLTRLFRVKIRENEKDLVAPLSLNHREILSHNNQKVIPGREREHTPLSNHLFEVISVLIAKLIPDNNTFMRLFNEFEMLVSLAYADQEWGRFKSEERRFWAPPGRFIWERSFYRGVKYGDDLLVQVFEQEGENWKPLSCGLFKHRLDELKELIKEWKMFLGRVRQEIGI